MSVALRFWSVVLLGLMIVTLIPAEQPTKTPPTKEQIAQWIKDLGNDDFDKREEASAKLWQAGPVAEAALVEALKSKDEEVRRRAKEIAEKFKYGVYAETPKKVVDLVSQYQTTAPTARAGLVVELLKAGPHGCRALMKLIGTEENAELKHGTLLAIADGMNYAVPSLLVEGNNDFELLDKYLDLCAGREFQSGVPNYCAYYLLRGQLDAAVAKVKNRKDLDEKQQQEFLAYLYRAKGDLKAARAAAIKAEQPELEEQLLREASEWKELAKDFAHKPGTLSSAAAFGTPWRKVSVKYFPGDIEKLGYGAAYQRLAGNKKEFENAIAAILELFAETPASDKEAQSFYVAKTLFLNDKPEEALQVLKNGGQFALVFEILCVQMRYREAFELLEQVRKSGEPATLLEILAARRLVSLGEIDKAKSIFAKLAENIKPGRDNPWFKELIDAEMRAGLREDAFAHAAEILKQFRDSGWPSRLLPKLFPDHDEAALVWFTFLATRETNLEPSAQLAKVRALLEGKLPNNEVEKMLAIAEVMARTKPGGELDRWVLALTDTALLYKMDATAEALLAKTETPAAQQRLGDRYAAKKQWDKAGVLYKAAWELDKIQPLPLYLYGQSLTKSGREAEGKKLMDQAHWLPLGNQSARVAFANALRERAQPEANRRESELLRRISEPVAGYNAGEGLRQTVSDALARKDYRAAAAGQEKLMLRCLNDSDKYPQVTDFVGVTKVHRLRASGLLEAGQLDEAKREITAALVLLPGDIELTIPLVVALEKRGQTKEATALFDKALVLQEKLCQNYPKCSWAHNSAAWLSVCCGRHLPAAKEHALKAVELAPTNAECLDTLSEVYFQLGDKDKAIALQKKAIELDPKKPYYRKQLKRMEAGDPKAERPPENEDED